MENIYTYQVYEEAVEIGPYFFPLSDNVFTLSISEFNKHIGSTMVRLYRISQLIA